MSVGECYRYAASSLGDGKHVVICLTQLAFHNQYFFIYLFREHSPPGCRLL